VGFPALFQRVPGAGDALEVPLILDGRFPKGADSYRTFMFDWVGHPPLSELAVAVRPRGANGGLTAWVSWNGATEVVTWQVNGGSSTSSLEPLATVKRTGFETAINFIPGKAQIFDVVALDITGQVLGRSSPIASIEM
jgi:hypothetical protein